MVPEYSEQGTSVALPTARPTPLFPKKAADAPESLHRSKLTFAPYWFVPVRPFCAQRGFPWAGQRLLTVGEEGDWLVSGDRKRSEDESKVGEMPCSCV